MDEPKRFFVRFTSEPGMGLLQGPYTEGVPLPEIIRARLIGGTAVRLDPEPDSAPAETTSLDLRADKALAPAHNPPARRAKAAR